jgi:hypothetical protein
VQVAELVCDWLEEHGYKLVLEPNEFGYPNRPTVRCERQARLVFVEVDSEIRLDRAREWASFSKSRSSDTRVIVAVPELPNSAQALESLRKEGIGLVVCGASCEEILIPADQTLNIGIPNLAKQRRPVQRLLGPAYEKIRRGEWQDGFDDACQALEQEARKHLVRGIASGRITLASGQSTLRQQDIRRMTIGTLARTYARIPNQTQVDRVVGDTLARINYDRVTVAHYRGNSRREARLKRNWMGHMWSIVPAIASIVR